MKLFFNSFSLRLSVLAVVIFFSSCSKKSVDIPSTVLSKEDMIPILVDLHLAQALVGINQFKDSTLVSLDEYSSAIFKLHHVERAKFNSSLEFYTAHPELLDEMYAEVINELSKKQSEAERK